VDLINEKARTLRTKSNDMGALAGHKSVGLPALSKT
jgi:hypothetical protein